MRGGELGSLRREAQVAVAGEHEADPGGRPVHCSDDRLGDAELEGEVGIELRAHAVAGHGHVVAEPGVVGTPLDMALQRPRVGTGTEAPARTGDDDDPDSGVGRGALQQRPVLRVHPARPGVEPVGTVQGDGGDAGVHRVAGDLQLGQLHVSPGWRSGRGGSCRPPPRARTRPGGGALGGSLEGARGVFRGPQGHDEPVVTVASRGPPQEAGLVRHQLGLQAAVQRQERLVRHSLRQPECGDLDDRHGQACTSITGLPSGSVMPASVGPSGTSKGSATTVAPSDTDLSSEARRSATWT